MPRLLPATLALILAAVPAAADEFTDTLESAMSAYKANNISDAREDLDYAIKLLGAMKAESLAKFLPAALPGWTREDNADAGAGGMMGMLGGGETAAATYSKDGADLTITLVANSPMVSGMAAMVSGMASLGGGKPMRIKRTEFSQTDEDLQGVVDGKVLVSVGGDAGVEDKKAYLETMDFDGLADF